MTVSELIEELRKYDGDMRVGVYVEDGLGYVKSAQVSTTIELSDEHEGDVKFVELVADPFHI